MNSTEVRLRAEEQVGLRRIFLPDEPLPEPVQPPKPAPLLSDEERQRVQTIYDLFGIAPKAFFDERTAKEEWEKNHEEACKRREEENFRRHRLRVVRESLLEAACPPPLDEKTVETYMAKVQQENSRRVSVFLAKQKSWRRRPPYGYTRFIPDRTLDLMVNLVQVLRKRGFVYSWSGRWTSGKDAPEFCFYIAEFVEQEEKKHVVDPFLELHFHWPRTGEEDRFYVDYWNETEFVPVYREV